MHIDSSETYVKIVTDIKLFNQPPRYSTNVRYCCIAWGFKLFFGFLFVILKNSLKPTGVLTGI
ncbi:MAG: hypothetical protein CTY19_11960 [Methylomonas sp.]|nr:MAG: hypothetical protein CTY19_11960 [Methylomonas sp.]